MKINARKKIILTLLALVGLILVLFVGIFFINLKIKNTEQDINDFLTSLENQSCRTEDLRSALAKIRDTQKKVEKYNEFLFQKGDELRLITDLETIAAKNNMTQNIVNSTLDNKASNIIEITIDVAGNFENALKYLLALERHPYFLNIKNLEFYPTGESAKDAESLLTNLRLHLTLYAN